MSHVSLRLEFEELVELDAPAIQVATGCVFTEGPVWHPVDHFLLFSDMPGDVRRRWDPHGGVIEVKRPSNKCNGMTYDADLNLIVCEHATSLLIREKPDGERDVLASHFEGKELNSPNDVCVRSDGSIYFTDPYYGRVPVFGVERPRELGFQAVYRVAPDGGDLNLAVDRDLFEQPNGLCLSPDEKLLYVNDSAKKLIRVFNVAPDGSLSGERLFANEIQSSSQTGGPDGMKCDERANVWVTGPGGVWVYAPSGELIGKLHIPEGMANLAWGRIAHPIFDRHPLGLSGHDESRPADRALHARARGCDERVCACRGAGARSRPASRCSNHSGHAERRGKRRRRFRRIGRARPRESAECHRKHSPRRSGGSRSWCPRHSCLVRCRAGRAWRHAERAAVQGARRAQGGGAGPGARRRSKGSSLTLAISSSRRCA
jgi:sugar lactone lactonase YvrE